ncbi:hypothetical protein BH09ACT7_BH09ACT7_40740 [soil metagenome]
MTVDRPLANALDLEVVHEISRAAFPRRCRKPRQRALTIADMGSDRQIERWLPAIAAGELIATIQPSGGPFAVVDSSFDLIVVAGEDCLRVVPVGNFDIESHEVEEGARRLPTIRAEATSDTLLPGSTGRADLLRTRRRGRRYHARGHRGVLRRNPRSTTCGSVSLWLKRGKALGQTYGPPRQHHARIAETIFGSSPVKRTAPFRQVPADGHPPRPA